MAKRGRLRSDPETVAAERAIVKGCTLLLQHNSMLLPIMMQTEKARSRMKMPRNLKQGLPRPLADFGSPCFG